jgi:hypothetical protein
MATTLTEPVAASNELAYASFDIVKFEKNEDGDIFVLGKASDDSVDSDEQIVDAKWMQKAVQDWLSTGANVRVQHNSQRDPAGVGVEAYTEKDGSTWVKSLVVEPVAKRLVEKGVLRAYSVGIARPKIMRDSGARGGRIVDGELCEISLVDRPANKNCGIQLVKSAKDGTAEYVDEFFGPQNIVLDLQGAVGGSDEDIDRIINKLQSTVGTITKTAGGETVTIDLPKDVSVSFSPADLAKLLKHRAVAEERVESGEIAEKRKMDPDVGGGVDRDKIPAADFAGKDRSFPIVTPKDAHDAAVSIGQAGDDNYSGDELKKNIIRIARRKGEAFVAALPDSWKKELGMNKAEDFSDIEKKKKGKKAFPGAKEPFGKEDADGKDSDGDGSDVDDKDSEAKPDATKGRKDCSKCGKGYDADTSMKNCEGCGSELPNVDKSEDASVEKKSKIVCQGCGAMLHDKKKRKFCTECGGSLASAKPLKKNHDHMCLKCDKTLDKGERFCGGCGGENPGYLPMADSKVKVLKGKPTPGEGVVGPGAAAIEPVPAHREPDGTAIEAFEHDAGLPTDPDSRYMKAADRFKTIGAPSDLGALHDHLCAAFHPDDVSKSFPFDSFHELNVASWQQKALDAAASSPLDEARRMTQMWQHAVTIKGTDPEVIADLRGELHKEFTDANKGPGTFPSPTELSPTRFRRPLLTAGQAAPSPGHAGANTHSVPTSHISASDFDRGPLTAGQAEDSPSNKGALIEPAPLPPGMSRTYYRNAMRDSAKSAMAAMHDHIANTFPDLCPMDGPGSRGEAPSGERPVPLPVGKSEDGGELTAKAQKLILKAQKAAKAAGLEGVFVDDIVEPEKKTVEPVAPAFDPVLIKTALAEATAPLMEQLAEAQKTLKKQQKRLDELADLPDPRDAPFKGLALKNSVNKTAAGVPVAARTVAENAERTQMTLLQELNKEARNNPDPAQREAAWGQINKMLGLQP